MVETTSLSPTIVNHPSPDATTTSPSLTLVSNSPSSTTSGTSPKTPKTLPKKRRKALTIKEKRQTLRHIEEAIKSGLSVRAACQQVGTHHTNNNRYKVTVEKASTVDCKVNGGYRKIHPGKKGVLEEYKDVIERAIFELREQGIQVNTRYVRIEAGKLSPGFRAKSPVAKEHVIRRFIRRVGLCHRIGTHVAQKNHKETAEDSADFIKNMRPIVAGRDPDDVLNMDQTPIPFSYHSKKTLEKKGAKTVHVRASTTDTKRATLAAAVTGSGELLPPMLIFKGKKDGRIAKKDIKKYPVGSFYACQPKVWMDEEKMHEWINLVLIPWIKTRRAINPHAVLLLLLDSYRVHMMGPVVQRIQSLGVEVQHIPGGCTYLCQPVDVGINRPIKRAMEEQWEEWMYNGGGIKDGEAMTPSRELVAEWVIGTYKKITKETGKNAWMKKGYEWF
jgi:hypothetical protein